MFPPPTSGAYAASSEAHGCAASASAWPIRSALVGAGLGVALSAVDQAVVWATSAPSAAPRFIERMSGVSLTSAAYGLLLGAVGLSTSRLLRTPSGRRVATSSVCALITVLVALHAGALGVRVLSGSHVTLGALDFLVGSWRHVGRAILVTYTPYTLCAVGIGAAVATLAAFALRSAALDVARPPRVRWLAILSGLLVALSAGPLMASGGHGNLDAVWQTTPELALFDSAELGAPPAASARSPLTPVVGPALAAGTEWDRRAGASVAGRPNVLLILLESVAVSHLGYAGYARPVTPHLDQLARDSARFTHAYTTATHSNYAQMAVLSSLFPRRMKTGLDTYQSLDYPRVLLHDLLHAAGFVTATVSSQDETWQGMIAFERTPAQELFWHARDYSGPIVDTGTERAAPDHATADRAIEWLSTHVADRFGLYVNLQATHFPYKLPAGVRYEFEPATPRGTFTYVGYPQDQRPAVINRYDSALHYVDEQIGRLVGYLAETKQLDDTLIVITSDHGELFHDHGLVTHGRTLYEGEARVPLLVRWPGHVAAREVTRPVSHLDILPTIANLLGLAPHPAFQGQDALADGTEHAAVFLNIQGWKRADGVVCWPYKLVIGRSDHTLRLFQLERDPDEADDRSLKEPQIAAGLAALIDAQMDAQVEYHAVGDARHQRFAPRLLSCPASESARP